MHWKLNFLPGKLNVKKTDIDAISGIKCLLGPLGTSADIFISSIAQKKGRCRTLNTARNVAIQRETTKNFQEEVRLKCISNSNKFGFLRSLFAKE